jgi:hypothetical protein
MAKVRAGIEIPIIPEDFEPSSDTMRFDIMKSCLEQADRRIQDEAFAVDWAVAESLFDHCC